MHAVEVSPALQSASLELIGLGLLAVIGLGYAIAEIRPRRKPIAPSDLRAQLARIGVSSAKGTRHYGRVDGIEVEVEDLRSSHHPYLVTATTPTAMDGLAISSVAGGPRADRVLTGDPEFDAVVQVVGPRLTVLALLGVAERALLLEAVSAGWSFGRRRWVRFVQWPQEAVRQAEFGARLAQTLSGPARRRDRPIENLARLYRTDPVAGPRARRLELLLELGGELGLDLARGALEDPQDEVRLVAALGLGHLPTLLDLVMKTASESLRKQAFDGILRAGDPSAPHLAREAFANIDPSTPHVGAIGELVATHPFPGRLELGRRWAERGHPRLRPHAFRILGLEGDRSDLERLVEPRGHPELEHARALIRARLVERGHDGGQLALSSEGGELSVAPQTETAEEDTPD